MEEAEYKANLKTIILCKLRSSQTVDTRLLFQMNNLLNTEERNELLEIMNNMIHYYLSFINENY